MDTAQLGHEIYTAERDAVPVSTPSDRFPELDPAGAYEVQEQYAQLRKTEDGAALVGRKIGCTSAAIQELFGIDTPDYGQIFDDMVVESGDRIEHGRLIAPMVEPEITFVLGRELRGPGVTANDVLGATHVLLPTLEIIDSRVRDWRIEFVDTVADNGSSARCVFGAELSFSAGRDLAAETVVLVEDGDARYVGDGAAVLGHPANSVAWLANTLAAYGQSLRSGDYVLSGSMTRATPAVPGRTYHASFDSLGTVSCRFD